MRAILLALLMLVTALAGCTGDSGDGGSLADDFRDDDGDTGDAGGEGGGPDDGAGAGDDGGGDDTDDGPSEGRITVDLGVDQVQITAPATFTFTGDARFFDGDDVEVDAAEVDATWVLFAVDDALGLESEGTVLPAQATFQLDEPGAYEFGFGVVADGFADGYASVTVTVVANDFEESTLTFSGTGTALHEPLLTGEPVEDSGDVEHAFTLPAGATRFYVDIAWDDSGLDFDYYLYAPDGTLADQGTTFNNPLEETMNREQRLYADRPAQISQGGEWIVTVSPFIAYESAYDVTVTFQGDPLPFVREYTGVAVDPSCVDGSPLPGIGGIGPQYILGLSGYAFAADPDTVRFVWFGDVSGEMTESTGELEFDELRFYGCLNGPGAPTAYTMTVTPPNGGSPAATA